MHRCVFSEKMHEYMMQNAVILLFLFVTTTYAGYAGSYSGNFLGSGGTSGSYGYGYGGDIPPGFPQQFFQQIPFDFSGFLAGYLDALKKHHQTLTDKKNAIAYTSVSLYPTFQGKVTASSRITYDGLNQLQNTIQQQANAAGTYSSARGVPPYSGYGSGGYGDVPINSGGVPSYGSYGYGFGDSHGGDFGGSFSSASGAPGGYGAGASASVGKDGVQQTAFLNPENPGNPNVNVRFGGSPDGKSYSVYTSSSSGSGNVDGKSYGFRRASTTVNDNGKVSTYTVTD